jgi:hypothetical protein
MVYKQYSKVILYPVVYSKDTNLNFIYDTNGNKVISKNYPEVLSTDNYVLLKYVNVYTPNTIVGLRLIGSFTLIENNLYQFKLKLRNNKSSIKSGDKLKIKISNLSSTEYSITPNNGLVSVVNNEVNFNINLIEDFIIEGEKSFNIEVYNEAETILYDTIIDIIAKDEDNSFNLLLLGPSNLRVQENYTTFTLKLDENYSIANGSSVNIEIVGNSADLIEIDPSLPQIFSNNEVIFKLKVIDSITGRETNNDYGSFEIKVTSEKFGQTEFTYSSIDIAPLEEIDENLLHLNMPRSLSLGKAPIAILNQNENEIQLNRNTDFFQYSVSNFTNANKEMIFLNHSSWWFDYGFDYNFPNFNDLIRGAIYFPEQDFYSLPYCYSGYLRFLDLNISYNKFVNDPWPNTEFSNILPNGSSTAKIINNNHYKYPIYDEINENLLGTENRISSTSLENDIVLYINENNELITKHAGQHARFNLGGQIDRSDILTAWSSNGFYSFIGLCSLINQYKNNLSIIPNPSSTISFLPNFINNNNLLNTNNRSIHHSLLSYKDLLPFNDLKIDNTKMNFNGEFYELNFLRSQTESVNNYNNKLYYNLEETNNNTVTDSDADLILSLDNQPEPETNLNSNFLNYLNYYNSVAADQTNTSITDDNSLFNSNDPTPLYDGTFLNIPDDSGYRSFYDNAVTGNIKIKSVKNNDQCGVFLDEHGSIRIVYSPYNMRNSLNLNKLYNYLYYNDGTVSLDQVLDSSLIFYNKNELENHFWIDENGLVEYLENKDFVDFEIYGSHANFTNFNLTFVYALHKSGKLYARELFTGIKNLHSNRMVCTLNTTNGLNVGDIIDVLEHDVNNLSNYNINFSISNKWTLIFKDSNLNKCVFQTDNVIARNTDLSEEVQQIVENPYRGFFIYKDDVLINLRNQNTYTVLKIHSETNFGYAKDVITDTMYEPLFDDVTNIYTENEDPEIRKNISYLTYCRMYSKLEKIQPYINNELNPEFLTVNSNPYKLDTRGDGAVLTWSAHNPQSPNYTSLPDPHKKIYKWLDENTVELNEFNLTATDFSGVGYAYPVNIKKTHNNGILEHIKMSLKQITQNKKVLKIISNNISNDAIYGIHPSFIIKTNDYNNTIINDNTNDNFYSYSYEILIMDPCSYTGQQENLNNCFSYKEHFEILNPTINTKSFNMVNGYYTQVDWETIENEYFNEELYNLFVLKPIGNKTSSTIDLSNYYCPIRSASFGNKSLCLLNNDNECLVINTHKIRNTYYKSALKDENNYDSDYNDFNLNYYNTYWLYNRGTGYQHSSQLSFSLAESTNNNFYIDDSTNNFSLIEFPNSDYHVLYSWNRMIHVNQNDSENVPFSFIKITYPQNNLTTPVIFEETIYGLGNPPSSTDYPYGFTMNYQQLEFARNFTETNEDSTKYISKDTNYIDVLFYNKLYDPLNNQHYTGNDVILFKVKDNLNYKINTANISENFLYIVLSNGVIDSCDMGIVYEDSNRWVRRSLPNQTIEFGLPNPTFTGTTIYYLITIFNSIKQTAIGKPLRTPVEDILEN